MRPTFTPLSQVSNVVATFWTIDNLVASAGGGVSQFR